MGFQYRRQGATKLTMNKKYSKRIYGYTDMDPSICSVGWEAPAGTLATESNVCSIGPRQDSPEHVLGPFHPLLEPYSRTSF